MQEREPRITFCLETGEVGVEPLKGENGRENGVGGVSKGQTWACLLCSPHCGNSVVANEDGRARMGFSGGGGLLTGLLSSFNPLPRSRPTEIVLK